MSSFFRTPTYDPKADAFYVRFSEARILESEEIKPGIVFDFDDQGHIVGIEVLDAIEQIGASVLSQSQAAE